MTLAGMQCLFLKGMQLGRKHSNHFTVTFRRNAVSVSQFISRHELFVSPNKHLITLATMFRLKIDKEALHS